MALELSPPLRWRFTDPGDVAAHGDRWWPWDERGTITRLDARKLIEIEEIIGIPLPAVIDGLRSSATLASIAAMWISMRLEGHHVQWSEFYPIALVVEWEAAPKAPLDSGKAASSGEAVTPDSPSSSEPAAESATS